jgi:hypothetical protein
LQDGVIASENPSRNHAKLISGDFQGIKKDGLPLEDAGNCCCGELLAKFQALSGLDPNWDWHAFCG